MFKVVLVDDEIWSLAGLYRTFDWETLNFQVVGQFSDPEEACQRILDLKPDVVFTDIRMPVMNGLELMEKVKLTLKKTEFVIISGFAEFSYAQAAVRQGAFDYILKPIDSNAAANLLSNLYNRLIEKKDLEYEAAISILYKSWRKSLSQMEDREPIFWALYGNVQTINEINLAINTFSVLPYKEGMAFLVGYGTDNFQAKINKSGNEPVMEIVLGISHAVSGGNEEQGAMAQAQTAFYSALLTKKYGIRQYEAMNIARVQKMLYKVQSVLAMYNGDRMIQTLQSVRRAFEKEMAGAEEILYFWNEMLNYLKAHYSKLSIVRLEHAMSLGELIQRFSGIHKVFGTIEDLCTAICRDYQYEDRNLIINKNFYKLLEYVDSHCFENLQLKDLAEMYHLNYTYSCELFKKAKGCTFGEYLGNIRMEQAGKMLKDPTLAIYEIAQILGFSDHFYFSKSFKKYYGISPSEYRKTHMDG